MTTEKKMFPIGKKVFFRNHEIFEHPAGKKFYFKKQNKKTISSFSYKICGYEVNLFSNWIFKKITIIPTNLYI